MLLLYVDNDQSFEDALIKDFFNYLENQKSGLAQKQSVEPKAKKIRGESFSD